MKISDNELESIYKFLEDMRNYCPHCGYEGISHICVSYPDSIPNNVLKDAVKCYNLTRQSLPRIIEELMLLREENKDLKNSTKIDLQLVKDLKEEIKELRADLKSHEDANYECEDW